jgi:glycosyltransferase involved in cell wall biosynthesis
MIQKPFISVVMPCYNQAIYLREGVESIVFQTYDYWELIIVDDGSPDACADVGRNLAKIYSDKRIRVFKKENNGLSSARNYGIARAMGDWILCLDSDDKVTNDYLEKVAKVIIERKGTIHFIYANQQFFGENNWKWEIPNYSHERILEEGIMPVQTVFKREDWSASGGFNEVLPWGHEDLAFWVGISALGDRKAVRMPEFLLLYRYKRHSMQREQSNFQELGSMMRTLHPHVYSVDRLLKDHTNILHTICFKTVVKLLENLCKFTEVPSPYFWIGLFFERHEDFELALAFYRLSLEKTILLTSTSKKINTAKMLTNLRKIDDALSTESDLIYAGDVQPIQQILHMVRQGGRDHDLICAQVFKTEEMNPSRAPLVSSGSTFSRYLEPKPPKKLDWQSFWRIGVVYAKLGRKAEAMEFCRQAISLRRDLQSHFHYCYDLAFIKETGFFVSEPPVFI